MSRSTTAQPMKTCAAIATACAALALPASAAAHSSIESYSPRPGSAVSRDLSLVKVNFKSRITDGKLTVERAGSKVSRGDGTVARRHRQVRVRLRSGLRAGRYTASVRWLSPDGHIQSKSWSFRVR